MALVTFRDCHLPPGESISVQLLDFAQLPATEKSPVSPVCGAAVLMEHQFEWP